MVMNSIFSSFMLLLTTSKLTLSTVFTFMRILLVPCILYSMMVQQWGMACLFFMLAALTDTIDGTLARWMHEETELGAYLDPVADKLLILSCYTTLLFTKTPLFTIPPWFVLAILGKELVLMAGALYVCFVKQSALLKPTKLGKLTMVMQVVFYWMALTCCLAAGSISRNLFSIFIYSLVSYVSGTYAVRIYRL